MEKKNSLPDKNKIILQFYKDEIAANENGNLLQTKLAVKVKEMSSSNLKLSGLSVSLKLYDPTVNCLTVLSRNELAAFSEFCVKVKNYKSPTEIMNTQFNCTIAENKDSISRMCAKKLSDLKFTSDQLDMHHYKLSNKARIHGVWKDNRFKLMWIDPNHEVHK